MAPIDSRRPITNQLGAGFALLNSLVASRKWLKPRADDIDVAALFAAIDWRRTLEGLSWRQVAEQIWEQSSILNRRRPHDHPLSPSTISGLATRGETSCQHALFFLRWLGRTPESFVPGAAGGPCDKPLPDAGPDRRLRWNLKQLYAALDGQRRDGRLTWQSASLELGCSASQLTGLRTARFATGLTLAMRIVRRLDRPAADFVYAARW